MPHYVIELTMLLLSAKLKYSVAFSNHLLYFETKTA